MRDYYSPRWRLLGFLAWIGLGALGTISVIVSSIFLRFVLMLATIVSAIILADLGRNIAERDSKP